MLGKARPYLLERSIGQKIEWKKYRVYWYEELFRDELKRQCRVFYHGPGYCKNYQSKLSIPEVIENAGHSFDIILTSCTYETFKGLNNVNHIPKVHIATDLYDGGPRAKKSIKHCHKHDYNLLFGFSSIVTDFAKYHGCAKNYDILPFSVDINVYQKWNIPKLFDIMASFSASRKSKFYPFRYIMKQRLKNMDLKIFSSRSYYIENVWKINQSRICLNYLPQGFFNPRYFEVLACGGFLLTDMPRYDRDIVGLVPGKHFAVFDGALNFKKRVIDWLNHPKERRRIAHHGMRFVRRHHSTKVRVRQFIDKIYTYLERSEHTI